MPNADNARVGARRLRLRLRPKVASSMTVQLTEVRELLVDRPLRCDEPQSALYGSASLGSTGVGSSNHSSTS